MKYLTIFCRINTTLLLSSTLCFSQSSQKNTYNQSIIINRVNQALKSNDADTVEAKKILAEITSEIQNNINPLTLLSLYTAKAIILTKCKNYNESLAAANQALIISNGIQQKVELIDGSKQKHTLLYIIIALSLGILTFAFREHKLKKSANTNLSIQKNEIEVQKQIVDNRNRDITDSLNYAQRIQNAILKTSSRLESFFSESFILFIPKDIVSGDFYWVKSKNGQALFAIADCTGHGVPGAFMSIIGIYGLNNLVNEFNLTNPGEILNEMNNLFKKSFDQSEGAEIFDGMDIGLCLYNPATKELNYAGANLPLYILRENKKPQPTSQIVHINDLYTLYQVKPNKQPIGYIFEETKYVTHCIQLMEGDTLYFFTDGFADQFGGLYRKKFRYQELRKLICEIAHSPLNEQKSILYNTFKAWKNDNVQVDDISFLGVKIS